MLPLRYGYKLPSFVVRHLQILQPVSSTHTWTTDILGPTNFFNVCFFLIICLAHGRVETESLCKVIHDHISADHKMIVAKVLQFLIWWKRKSVSSFYMLWWLFNWFLLWASKNNSNKQSYLIQSCMIFTENIVLGKFSVIVMNSGKVMPFIY